MAEETPAPPPDPPTPEDRLYDGIELLLRDCLTAAADMKYLDRQAVLIAVAGDLNRSLGRLLPKVLEASDRRYAAKAIAEAMRREAATRQPIDPGRPAP